jgi:hypothetical protein
MPKRLILLVMLGLSMLEFPVRVDLSDGMDSAEAILVGTSLYEFNMKQKNYEVKETLANDDGTWAVYLLLARQSLL